MRLKHRLTALEQKTRAELPTVVIGWGGVFNEEQLQKKAEAEESGRDLVIVDFQGIKSINGVRHDS